MRTVVLIADRQLRTLAAGDRLGVCGCAPYVSGSFFHAESIRPVARNLNLKLKRLKKPKHVLAEVRGTLMRSLRALLALLMGPPAGPGTHGVASLWTMDDSFVPLWHAHDRRSNAAGGLKKDVSDGLYEHFFVSSTFFMYVCRTPNSLTPRSHLSIPMSSRRSRAQRGKTAPRVSG